MRVILFLIDEWPVVRTKRNASDAINVSGPERMTTPSDGVPASLAHRPETQGFGHRCTTGIGHRTTRKRAVFSAAETSKPSSDWLHWHTAAQIICLSSRKAPRERTRRSIAKTSRKRSLYGIITVQTTGKRFLYCKSQANANRDTNQTLSWH